MLTRFYHDARGATLIVAGVCFLVLVAVAGAGFDFAKRELVRLKLQQTADAAALAGALLPIGTSEAERRTEVMRYYRMNFPEQYLGIRRPDAPQITITNNVEVATRLDIRTSFITNLGFTTLPVRVRSLVTIGGRQVDFDVVLVVDESASNGGGCTDCEGLPRIIKLREAAGTLVNAVFDGTKNPNVRMGMIGYSGRVIDKWGLTSEQTQAQEAVDSIGMVNENYDHFALRAAYNMITGNSDPSVTSGRQANALCGEDNPHVRDYILNGQLVRFDMDAYIVNTLRYPANVFRDHGIRWNWQPCAPADNSNVPPPRTDRADGKPVSPVKNVIFETDGLIMYEPPPCLPPDNTGTPTNYGSGGCPNYPAFLAECERLKRAGVNVFTISYQSQARGDVEALSACASIDPLTGQPQYYFAPGSEALKSIFRNIGTTIRKVRIAE